MIFVSSVILQNLLVRGNYAALKSNVTHSLSHFQGKKSVGGDDTEAEKIGRDPDETRQCNPALLVHTSLRFSLCWVITVSRRQALSRVVQNFPFLCMYPLPPALVNRVLHCSWLTTDFRKQLRTHVAATNCWREWHAPEIPFRYLHHAIFELYKSCISAYTILFWSKVERKFR